MAKKKPAVPEHVEPEDVGREMSEAAGGASISKAEAIRRVMADGIDNPSLGSQEIEKRFGIEVTPQHFSATKAQMKSRDASKKSKPARQAKQVAESGQAVEGYLAPPPKPSAPDDPTDLLAALEAMKPLVARLGADKVKRMVDLLG